MKLKKGKVVTIIKNFDGNFGYNSSKILMNMHQFNTSIKKAQFLEHEMYDYGFSCGQNSFLNFNAIYKIFGELHILESEQPFYIQKIIEGFKDGSI